MIDPDQAKLLREYLILLENDAFLCGEAAGTDAWYAAYQRLQSDIATVHAYIDSLTVRPI